MAETTIPAPDPEATAEQGLPTWLGDNWEVTSLGGGYVRVRIVTTGNPNSSRVQATVYIDSDTVRAIDAAHAASKAGA